MKFLGLTVEEWGAIATVVALGVAVWQMRVAQRWKRAEFVATAIRDLEGDSRFATFRTLTDYRDTKIKVDGEERMIKGEELAAALDLPAVRQIAGRSGTADFTPIEHHIRDVFDFWFDFLDRCEHNARSKVINPKDVKPHVKYWLDRLQFGSSSHEDATLVAVKRFAQEFHPDAVKFVARIGYLDWGRSSAPSSPTTMLQSQAGPDLESARPSEVARAPSPSSQNHQES